MLGCETNLTRSACNMSELGGEVISSTQSMVLDLPPSCIEFCPSHPSFFVVGTYYLEKAEEADQPKDGGEDSSEAKTTQPQSRNGSIIVLQLQDGKALGQPFPFSALDRVPHMPHIYDAHCYSVAQYRPYLSHLPSLIFTFRLCRIRATSAQLCPARGPSPSSGYVPIQTTVQQREQTSSNP